MHGISGGDQTYWNGLAFVNEEGYVQEISGYLLAPNGLNESYGDRP
ncbi:hypothetical protein J7J63_05755 [Candidatus Bipolaricaulota bacterium]|nr:hypothetical protein [Candidatus Bipolaricaulota bacterium]